MLQTTIKKPYSNHKLSFLNCCMIYSYSKASNSFNNLRHFWQLYFLSPITSQSFQIYFQNSGP